METLQRCSRGLMLAAITCMMLLQSAVAQETRQITGTVTDSAGAPLPGVSIVVKGTQNGTSTDLNGKFSIQVAPSDILEFSLLGYLATERPVGTAAQLDVQLEMAGYQLSDVVVIGYQTASRRSVTTSIASVSAEDIQSQVTGNVANAIQGKLPGVQILPGSGLPGSQPTILIRGLSSLTGNTTPLIIVDGIEMGYNALNFLNPSDIQRIDVLKDASASAIYGSRAGQGVILITTKKGGGKPVIQVESSLGFDYMPDLNLAGASEFARIMNRIAENSGLDPYFPNPESLQGTDYWDMAYDVGITQDHLISARGGKDGLSLYGSLGYFRQDSYNATDKGGNWTRITARLNAELDVSEKFTMGLNLAPRYEKWLSTPDVTFSAYAMDPTTSPFKTEDSVYRAIPEGFMDFTAFNPYYSLPNRSSLNGVTNPYFAYYTNFNENEAFGAQYATFLQFTPIPNLVLKSQLEGFATVTSSEGYSPKYYLATNANNKESTLSSQTGTNARWKITNTANYRFGINDHQVDVLLGQSADKYTVKGTRASRKNIPFDTEPYQHIAAASEVVDGSGYYQPGATDFGKMLSFFGSLRYDYKGKYYLSGSMRADASSLVNPAYRWGYFPTLSAAWIISEEGFFENLKDKINYLKLRASWGRAGGNLPGTVGAYLTTIAPVYYTDANGNPITGYTPSNIADPRIKWEVQEDYTLGLDAGFFNDRLNLTLETFIRRPQNLLIDVRVDPALGYPQGYIPTQPSNVGKLTTHGWDLGIGYRGNVGPKLSWGADLTLSHWKSIVDHVGNADPVLYARNNDVISTFRSRLTQGHEPGAWFGYIVDGVFQTDEEAIAYVNAEGVPYQPLAKAGDLKFRDVTGDGVIDNGDLTDIGSPWPKLTSGLTLTLQYGRLDFRAEFYGAFGHEYSNDYRLLTPALYNFPSGWGDQFWNGPGTSNAFPILRSASQDQNGNFSKMSEFLLEDADFLRCRLIQIGYTIPAAWVKGIQTLRVYASAQNLFTISGYSGLNPDLPFQGIGFHGVDRFQAVPANTFLFGISLGL